MGKFIDWCEQRRSAVIGALMPVCIINQLGDSKKHTQKKENNWVFDSSNNANFKSVPKRTGTLLQAPS